MLTIQVENNTIYLNGTQEESAGTQLNGYVELYLNEPTRFKKLTLQFAGTLRLNWEEEKENKKSIAMNNKRHHKYKKIILQKEWQFIDNQKWLTTTHLASHTKHRYPFQMILPGNISESMDAHPYGTLTYELKATAIKPSLSSNLITCLPIHIIRLQPDRLLSGLFGDNRILQLSNTWEQKVNYHIQLNKKIYQRGEPIQIHFTFQPLTQGLKIRHLSCFLKEHTTIKLDDNNHHTQSKIISLVRNDKFPCRGNEWKNSETLIIPRSSQNSQFDLIHPFLEIEHKLKFTIHFVQLYGQQSQLHLTIPIRLCEESNNNNTTNTNTNTRQQLQQRSLSLDDLPRYEDACLLMPYDPQQWVSTMDNTMPSLSPPYSPRHHHDMNWDHEITTPEDHPIYTSSLDNCIYNNNNNDGIDDYFSYQPSHSTTPLQRVPSYETAIRSSF